MSGFNLAEFCTQEPRKYYPADRVLYVSRVEGGLSFSEECDGWFSLVLTEDQVIAMCDRMKQMLGEQP